MVCFAFSMRSSNRSQRAVMRARGSAWTICESYDPRPPDPMRPTEIFELAWYVLAVCGAMIANVAAPAALPERKVRRDTGGFSIRFTSDDCICSRQAGALVGGGVRRAFAGGVRPPLAGALPPPSRWAG